MSYRPSFPPSRSATLPIDPNAIPEDDALMHTIIYLDSIPQGVAWPTELFYVDSAFRLVHYVEVIGWPGYYQIPDRAVTWDVSFLIRTLPELFPYHGFCQYALCPDVRRSGAVAAGEWPQTVLRVDAAQGRVDEVSLVYGRPRKFSSNVVIIAPDSVDAGRIHHAVQYTPRRSDTMG